jgi:hypothetical protein
MVFLSRAMSVCALTACTLVLVAACGGGGGGGDSSTPTPTDSTGTGIGTTPGGTTGTTSTTPTPEGVLLVNTSGLEAGDIVTPVPAGFASVAKFVPAGQAKQDLALTNCETTIFQGTASTTTTGSFTTATLSLIDNGDVMAVFSDTAGKLSGVRVTPAAMRDININSNASGMPMSEQHYLTIEFQYGDAGAELSVDYGVEPPEFVLASFSGENSAVVSCSLPASGLVRQTWPQPDMLGAYLQGVTALNTTRTNTSTLADGLLRWDNLNGSVAAIAEQAVNRFLQVNLSTGVLSSAGSPRATATSIAWPAYPNTIAGFSLDIQEKTFNYGTRSDTEIAVTPSSTAPQWSLRLVRTNNSVQPISSLAASAP